MPRDLIIQCYSFAVRIDGDCTRYSWITFPWRRCRRQDLGVVCWIVSYTWPKVIWISDDDVRILAPGVSTDVPASVRGRVMILDRALSWFLLVTLLKSFLDAHMFQLVWLMGSRCVWCVFLVLYAWVLVISIVPRLVGVLWIVAIAVKALYTCIFGWNVYWLIVIFLMFSFIIIKINEKLPGWVLASFFITILIIGVSTPKDDWCLIIFPLTSLSSKFEWMVRRLLWEHYHLAIYHLVIILSVHILWLVFIHSEWCAHSLISKSIYIRQSN